MRKVPGGLRQLYQAILNRKGKVWYVVDHKNRMHIHVLEQGHSIVSYTWEF